MTRGRSNAFDATYQDDEDLELVNGIPGNIHAKVRLLVRQIFANALESTEIDFDTEGLGDDDVKALMYAFNRNPRVAQKITNIFLHGNDIYTIKIAATLTGLNILDISNNKLISISIPETLTQLTQLQLSRNLLTTIVIPAELISLEDLDVADNLLFSVSTPDTLKHKENGSFEYTPKAPPTISPFLHKRVWQDSEQPEKRLRPDASEANGIEELASKSAGMHFGYNKNVNPGPAAIVAEGATVDVTGLAKQFIATYWNSYDQSVSPDLLDDEMSQYVSIEDRTKFYDKFVRDLERQFALRALARMPVNSGSNILNILSRWRDPALFNLHPVKNTHDIFTSGAGISSLLSRFSSLFFQPIVLRTGF